MAIRTASLVLVASATSLKEILWDSLFAFKYFPGDSIVSGSCVSPSDSTYNLLKRFSKIIINGFHPFVNRAYPLLTDVSNNIPMEEDRFTQIEDEHIISRCNYTKLC